MSLSALRLVQDEPINHLPILASCLGEDALRPEGLGCRRPAGLPDEGFPGTRLSLDDGRHDASGTVLCTKHCTGIVPNGSFEMSWWAHQDSNLEPLPPESNALPLRH